MVGPPSDPPSIEHLLAVLVVCFFLFLLERDIKYRPLFVAACLFWRIDEFEEKFDLTA